MSVHHRAREACAQIVYCLGLEYKWDDGAIKDAEAILRMLIREVTTPYEDLCEAATDFLNGGEFYLPGNPSAMKRLDRYRRAVEQYGHTKSRLREEESGA